MTNFVRSLLVVANETGHHAGRDSRWSDEKYLGPSWRCRPTWSVHRGRERRRIAWNQDGRRTNLPRLTSGRQSGCAAELLNRGDRYEPGVYRDAVAVGWKRDRRKDLVVLHWGVGILRHRTRRAGGLVPGVRFGKGRTGSAGEVACLWEARSLLGDEVGAAVVRGPLGTRSAETCLMKWPM